MTSLGLARLISELAQHDVPVVTVDTDDINCYFESDPLPHTVAKALHKIVNDIASKQSETGFIMLKIISVAQQQTDEDNLL